MGGGNDTKLTLEQVQQKLLRELCENANKLLANVSNLLHSPFS
jgi:hypothetical protein